jgi:diguanylate cyclase (GGDEF)-like protein
MRGEADAGPAMGLPGDAAPRAPLDPRKVLTAIGEVVYDWDLLSDAIAWGINAPDVLGVPDLRALSTGHAFSLAIEPGGGRTRSDAIFDQEGADAGGGVPYRARYALRLKGGKLVFVEDTGRWYADADGRPVLAHGVLRIDRNAGTEPGERSASSRERNDFLSRIKADVGQAARSKQAMSLLVIAIDELGRLNEDLGYEAAEALIEEVGRRLRAVMRRGDCLARYAGNRFAMALVACPPDQAVAAAKRLAEIVEGSPIESDGGPVRVRLHVGAATAPQHALDAPALLRRAEEALAAAKRGNGTAFAMFDPMLGRKVVRRIPPPAGLEVVEALNARRIVLARQPVIDAHSRVATFHEALLRLRAEDGRIVGASDILPSAERSGLMPLVDARILELAADHLAAHPAARLSINVSPATIETADWLGTLAAHLGARRGIASRLVVEISERALMRDPQATHGRLAAMKALGIAIAIDGFGAGHTSFEHLRGFPVDIVKIDGAFVQNLSRSTDDRFFLRAFVGLAGHLGIITVAEWVEDEETARLLTEWGVDYLQGRHCGAPALIESAGDEAERDAA